MTALNGSVIRHSTVSRRRLPPAPRRRYCTVAPGTRRGIAAILRLRGVADRWSLKMHPCCHRAPHRRATPPQPLFRRGAAGAWVLAAGNSAALAGATRRACTPAAGRRQSAFGAAARRLSAPHARRRRPRTAAHPRSYARVSVGSTRRACRKPAGEPPGDVLGVSAPPQCAHHRSARHLRQRRICGRQTSRAHTDCESPPFGVRSAPPPPDCAAPAAAAASAPHAAGAELLSLRPIEASRAGGS